MTFYAKDANGNLFPVTPTPIGPQAGAGAICVTLATDIGSLAVADSQSAPFLGAVAMTVGTTYAAGRSVRVFPTVSGNVEFQFADGSTLVEPVFANMPQTFPYSVTMIVAAGTSATATFFNLK
jgi:hypothetical protein